MYMLIVATEEHNFETTLHTNKKSSEINKLPYLGEASKISIPAGCRLTYWRIEAAITAEAWLGQLFFSY